MRHVIDLLLMGKYAAYVWPAYGLVAIVFFAHFLRIRRQHRRVQDDLRLWFDKSL